MIHHRTTGSGRLTVGSLFSGIGAFDLGFEDAGFVVAWQVEINADARATLQRRFPNVRLETDVRHVGSAEAVLTSAQRIKALSWPLPSVDALRIARAAVVPAVDVLIGGFPCQDVSVAGQRAGLSGSRTGLFWQFMRLVDELQPRVVVAENVPGLLSSNGGRDFHTVLSALAERGFRRAYRILDSQYFGVPQRRRRVFIVGCARDSGLDPRAILFESASGIGDLAPRRQARPRVASTIRGRAARAGVNVPGRWGEDDYNLVTMLRAAGHHGSNGGGIYSDRAEAPTLDTTGDLAICGPLGGGNDGIGRRSEDDPNLVFQCHGSNVGEMGTLRTGNGNVTGVPFVAATLNSGGNDGGFRTEPGEHLVVHEPGERARALVGSMHKRHDDDTDTLVPMGVHANQRGELRTSDLAGSLSASRSGKQFEGIAGPVLSGPHGYAPEPGRGDGSENNIIPTLGGVSGRNQIEQPYLPQPVGVRRLTPLECEKLQGLPPGWTCACGEGHRGSQFCTCPDTPRYQGCGNAVTRNVAAWIAQRLKAEFDRSLSGGITGDRTR